MARNPEKALHQCIERMLRPIVRLALGRSLGIQVLTESLKKVLLEVAEEEMETRGEKVNMRRLSVVTGIHRRDVDRIYKRQDLREGSSGFIGRVIMQWRRDPLFQTKSGRPKVLTFKGEDAEFKELVELVSKDIKPGTVLFELERLGAVEKTPHGLKLLARGHIPQEDPAEEYDILGEDSEYLMEAIIENLEYPENSRPNFHATTIFDNIREEDIPKIQKWFHKHCSAFHRRVESLLSKSDVDFAPSKKGKKSKKPAGKKVVFGSFSKMP
ncbi:MAG: hypothetical protein KDD53_02740 [Bdellovibrionales bacterium]|nr:hypothetical protein [Bdellovibrionales bacterium]